LAERLEPVVQHSPRTFGRAAVTPRVKRCAALSLAVRMFGKNSRTRGSALSAIHGTRSSSDQSRSIRRAVLTTDSIVRQQRIRYISSVAASAVAALPHNRDSCAPVMSNNVAAFQRKLRLCSAEIQRGAAHAACRSRCLMSDNSFRR
jgi:hypothetical protein